MPATPEDILLAGFQAFHSGDAAAFAQLVVPSDEAELRTHVAGTLDAEARLPSPEAFSKAPYPPGLAEFLQKQVSAGYRQVRQHAQRHFGVRDAAGLTNLTFAQVIAGAWSSAHAASFQPLECQPLGTVINGDEAFVLFRFAAARHPDSSEMPTIARFVRVADEWRLHLSIRAPLLLPGTEGLYRALPNDMPPDAAG